jgi:crotonobetaine/carnitine-CoA ligase
VAILARTSIEAIVFALACSYLGAPFTMINDELSPAMLSDAIEAAGPRLLVADHDLLATVPRDAPCRKRPVLLFGPPSGHDCRHVIELSSDASGLPASSVRWSDPLQICWTSGTTGASKGVILSHSHILHHTGRWLPADAVEPGDVFFSCTPFYLSGAWTAGIWVGLTRGITMALDRRFSVSQFWERTRHYRASHIFTLGTMHHYLWKQPPTDTDRDNPVRRAVCIPMDWQMTQLFKDRFGIQRIDQMFGNTETMLIVVAADDGTDWPKHAMGRAVPEYEIILVDDDDREVAIGEVGEVCVRPTGPGLIFSGYLNAAEDTVRAWQNLWYHQGDLARVDAEGIYYFSDRKKDYTRHKGRNIALAEVEAVAAEFELVEECAAFGVQSADLDSESELALAVVIRSGEVFDPAELAAFINERAPYYFVPRYIDVVESVPKNAHFKVLKNVLRERGVSEDVWDMERAGFVPMRHGVT